LKINIKIGNITNLSDARYAAGIGAGFAGFCLDKNKEGYLTAAKAKEITGWMEGPCLVGEWDECEPNEIAETILEAGIDYVQLNAFNPDIIKALQRVSIIQNIYIDDYAHTGDIIKAIDSVQYGVNHFMLSFRDNAKQDNYLSSHPHKLMLTEFCRDYPVWLNFDFTVGNILPLIEEFKPFGINLNGSPEDRTGEKDFDYLNSIVELLESNS